MGTTTIRAPLAAVACALTFVTGPAAAAAPAAGPFAKAPTLPTACYLENDTFSDKVAGVTAATQADIERQKAINQQIENDFNNIDPMVKAAEDAAVDDEQPAGSDEVGARHSNSSGAGRADRRPLRISAAFDAVRGRIIQNLVSGYEAALKQAACPRGCDAWPR